MHRDAEFVNFGLNYFHDYKEIEKLTRHGEERRHLPHEYYSDCYFVVRFWQVAAKLFQSSEL
jgi:hypothetical protein